ncbi:MAG: tetratricopeptide repeat protein [Dissulfurispiraceae bacterium]|jgi:tetratricopeptide (TPR) repeat protein
MKKIFLIIIAVMMLCSVTTIAAADDQPQQPASGGRQSWLGIKTRQLTSVIAQQMGLKDDKGLLLVDVVEGGPAAIAGLKKGDIIVECEGVKISETAQITLLVSVETPGTIVPIKIIRDGNSMTFNVTLGEPRNQAQPAVSLHNGVTEVKPDDAETCNKRGLAYRKSGNYQQAIDEYTKAIQLKPDFATAYNNRGVAYKKMGNYQQAIDDYSKAIELNPDYAIAYSNRGLAYRKAGNDQQAINDFKTAARLGDKVAQDELTKKGIEW